MAAITSQFAPSGYVPESAIGYEYLDNQIILTAHGAYTAVKLPSVAWSLRRTEDRKLMMYDLYRTLATLPRSQQHRLITTSYPFSADAWAEETKRWTAQRTTNADAYNRQVDLERDYINSRVHRIASCYIVARLGDRGTHNGRLAQVRDRISRFMRRVEFEDDMPSIAEIEGWREQARGLRLQLAGSPGRCQPVSQFEMEALIRRLTHPGLPVPDNYYSDIETYGPGDLEQLVGGDTEIIKLGRVGKSHVYDCVKHTTSVGTTYQIMFALSQGPNSITFPNIAFLNIATKWGFDLSQSVGFELRSRRDTEREAEKIINQVDEQRFNDAQVGSSTELGVEEKAKLAEDMKYSLDHQAIGVHWRALFSLARPDLDELREDATLFQQNMSNAGFTVDAPPSEQRFFFFEHLPCSERQDTEYVRKTQLDYLATSMPHVSASLGDMEGPFEGMSLEDGMESEPVFHEHLALATNEGQKAPIVAGVGDSGCGKTVSIGLHPVATDARRHITQVVVDPRGDYTVLGAYEEELDIDPGTVRLVNVLTADEGLMNPSAMATDEDKGDVASIMSNALIRMLPKHTADPATRAVVTDVLSEAVDTAVTEGNEYLIRPLEILEQWDRELNEADVTGNRDLERKKEWSGLLVRELRRLANTKLGRVLFAQQNTDRMDAAGKTTVFCTLGLTPPDPGTDPTDWDHRQILSDIIFGLMSDYIWAVMTSMDRRPPKHITWDEFHTAKDNPRVQLMVDRFKRLGRYHNLSLRLISQFGTDIPPALVTVAYAFGADDAETAKGNCRLVHIPENDANVQLFRTLAAKTTPKGRCIMRDANGNIGLLQSVIPKREWLNIFDTNPEKTIDLIAKAYGEEAAAERRALEEAAS